MKIKKQNYPRVVSALLISLLLVACSDNPQDLLTSAKDYLAKSDNKAAVIQIKNALQTDPNLPEARYLLGSALLESGDAVGAETELRKALDLQYPKDTVVPVLAKSQLAQGQAKKLTDEWANTELGTPDAKANLQMSLTSAYAMQGQTEKSQNALEEALQAQPGFGSAVLAQARQKAAKRDFDGALILVDDVIVQSPGSFEAWKLKGDIFLFTQHPLEQTLAAYRKAVDIKPDYLAGHVAVINLLLQNGDLAQADQQLTRLQKYQPNHPQTKYLAGLLAYQKKDYRQARDLAQLVLRAAPDNVLALQLSGLVALQLDALVQAQADLGRALQAAPGLPLARRALVLAYLRGGQPKLALETLLPGLAQAKVDPELLSVAGEVFLQNGDLKQAEVYFARAARQNPDDVRQSTKLALTHLMSGSTEAAFTELQRIAGSDEGITADVALIGAHLQRREFDKALLAIDALEKKQPEQPLAPQLRARTLLAQQDLAGAKKNFERAVTLDPGYFPAIAGLASLDMGAQNPAAAKARFDAVLAKDPKNSQALVALAEHAARTGAPKEEVTRLMARALAANPTQVMLHLLMIDLQLRQQDFRAAATTAQAAMVAFPDQPDVLNALGRTQMATGQFNQAIASYNKLVVLQSLSPLPFLRLAEAYLGEKNKTAAISSLRKALDLKPDLLEAQRALIALSLEDKRYTEATTLARQVQQQRPTEAVGYALEGDINAIQKNTEGAAAAYRAGIKRINAPELAMRLHAILKSSGQTAEADTMAANWQRDNPLDVIFLLYLGDEAIARKDYAAAEKNYAAVVKLQASNPVAYNNLAWVSAQLNRDGALAYAEKANALAPNQPVFMDTLAELLSKQGDYAKALALQTQVLALQPQNALFKLNLAKIHIKGGQKELARKELDALSKLGTSFAAQAEVSSLLQSL